MQTTSSLVSQEMLIVYASLMTNLIQSGEYKLNVVGVDVVTAQ